MGHTDWYWPKHGSPYIISNNAVVSDEAHLTVEAGVDIRFDPRYQLQVKGSISAEGTENEPIVMTTLNSNYSSMPMITFLEADLSRSSMSHVHMRGGLGWSHSTASYSGSESHSGESTPEAYFRLQSCLYVPRSYHSGGSAKQNRGLLKFDHSTFSSCYMGFGSMENNAHRRMQESTQEDDGLSS